MGFAHGFGGVREHRELHEPGDAELRLARRLLRCARVSDHGGADLLFGRDGER
jgi:hypothetical protein